MKALDQLIRDVPPGRTIVVRAQALGLSEGAFVRFANEIKEDEGIDDFDLVQLHRLGDSGWQSLDLLAAGGAGGAVDAVSLRRRKA
ncbi:hypothetical protein RCH10_000064 [Variovorax sp. GrIS 2.14]|uniref:hypothetical protein n=1 Tax=Variovorax sp. GrIS 2.14 TaxID=3071709 RepID=UPI0019B74496|nr:hypothetical protein [Variovorax sp.]